MEIPSVEGLKALDATLVVHTDAVNGVVSLAFSSNADHDYRKDVLEPSKNMKIVMKKWILLFLVGSFLCIKAGYRKIDTLIFID
ncbi:hypothetical protein WQ54_26770 [Bacillus sp. SA1-12]|uniref:hypothetical protein n=1 Tax=Bacillus sp. SA1-12 TaxID=1455638 RepID=UPI0006270685|nr:hypothetical protein [Bacillus sp. SA1-12]KKI89464.1 hypothetical protein WQ54_26770 [Bacillus sp. SA1-12]